jgi:hypothetical protein
MGYSDDLSEVLAFDIMVCGTQTVQQNICKVPSARKKIKT